MSSRGHAGQGSKSPKSPNSANEGTENKGSSFSIFRKKPRTGERPPLEKRSSSSKSFLAVFRPRSSRSPSPIPSPMTSPRPSGIASPSPPDHHPAQQLEENEPIPPLEPVTINARVLEQLRQWNNDHPETRLTQVLDRVAGALEFKPFHAALDAIPAQPFPVGPLIKGLAGLIAFGIKIPRRKRDAYDFAMQVVADLSGMADAFGVGNPEDKLYQQCKQELEPFWRANEVCAWAVQQLGSSLASSAEEERLDFLQKIADAKLFFLTLTTVRIVRELSGISKGVVQLLEYNERLGELKSLKELFGSRLAKQARYKEQNKDECHKATRSQVLAEINAWTQPSLSERNSQGMWVIGNAGVGKSSIAITTVKCLLDQRPVAPDEEDGESNAIVSDKDNIVQAIAHDPPVLLAHYFCNHLLDSADMNCLFPTLAMQLAENSPAAAHLITNAIARKPSIVDKFSENQAKAIFAEPLRQIATALAPKVITVMIDGVDEFRTGHASAAGTFPHRHITEVLVSVAGALPDNVRLLTLSRPQEEILAALPPTLSPSHIQRLVLDTKLSIGDVRTYFEHELPKIRFHHTTFPTSQQVDDLVTYSDGHLGWAKQTRNWLAVRLQTLSNNVDLDQELRQLGQTVHGDLYSLYRFLLEYLLKSHGLDQPRYLLGLQRVLHTLVVLYEPQSIDTISRLNDQDDGIEVRNCLKHLSGLYAHDSTDVNDQTVPRPHKSFYDFLVSSDAPPDLRVDTRVAHTTLAKACWRSVLTDDLHFNMGHYTTNLQTIEDSAMALSRIPELLRYACSSVIHHVVRSDESFSNQLVELITKRGLFWLEVLYMHGVSNTHSERRLELMGMQTTCSEVCWELLQHVIYFISTIGSALSYGPLFIYTLKIPFCPSQTRAEITGPNPAITLVSQQDGYIDGPRPCCSALSPDGRYAALLSADNLFVISPFDPAGYHFEANVTHSGHAALSFSQHAATLVVATLVDGVVNVKIFGVVHGTMEAERAFNPTVNGKLSTGLVSVELSPSGAYTLLSVEVPGEDRPESWLFVYHDSQPLWSMKVVYATRSRFYDENQIILQSDLSVVHLVDSRTGQISTVLTEQGSNVTAIAVSTSSVVIAAGDSVSVFKDGSNQRVISAPPLNFSMSTARFSADARLFVLGTKNAGIQLWSWASTKWTCAATFFAHVSAVQDVAFHPNGKHLVAIFEDGTIRISDISAIIEDRKWEIVVKEGVLAEAGWFSQHVPLGGWLWGGAKPEPFLFQYPFALPQGVALLNWEIQPKAGDRTDGQGLEESTEPSINIS